MTVQIIISKDIEDMPLDRLSEYLDETIINYTHSKGWIVDNISTI